MDVFNIADITEDFVYNRSVNLMSGIDHSTSQLFFQQFTLINSTRKSDVGNPKKSGYKVTGFISVPDVDNDQDVQVIVDHLVKMLGMKVAQQGLELRFKPMVRIVED